MSSPIFIVDAFTAAKFAGNSAAVCLAPPAASAEWMQNVAREMNLSETAFLERRDDGWNLRWFTPTVEVDLCGHATLASAHALWELDIASRSEPVRFHTKSGLLTATRYGGLIELDFPATPVTSIPPPDGLAQALGVMIDFCGQSPFDYLIEVGTEQAVRTVAPDFRRLATFPVRGVMVTSRSGTAGIDFVSRFFGPAAGIDEDPVTGSAHCALAPYWAPRLGKSVMRARQISARGGELEVALSGDRVLLRGQAVTALRGELL